MGWPKTFNELTGIKKKKPTTHEYNYATVSHTRCLDSPGMDKVREQGAPVPGNDNKN